MSERAPKLTEDRLGSEQRQLWEELVRGRRGGRSALVGADGVLVGPFDAMLLSPSIGSMFAALGEEIRFGVSIDARLLELAIITVGAHWRSDFEWRVHSRLAAEAGVGPEVIAAIGAGRLPPFGDREAAAVYRMTTELLGTTRVTDETFSAAGDVLGDAGVFELVATVGYYTFICLSLNAYEIPAGDGGVEPWVDT